MANYRVIYVADNVPQAEDLRQALARHRITAFLLTESLDENDFVAGEDLELAETIPGNNPDGPKIVVRRDDAEIAAKVVLDTLAGWQAARQSLPRLAEIAVAHGDQADWPSCPHCNRPRLTTCPVCQTSGTDFPAAFLPETDESAEGDHDAVMVLCPTCDEPFAPRFPARCEWCGHRFRDGYEPRPSSPGTYSSLFEDFNSRVMIVLVATAIVSAAVISWFFYVLR